MDSFIDLQHWQALQATLTLLMRLLSHLQAYNTQSNSELASPVCQQDIYKASHMRIKLTVVPNYYANSHIAILVYFRPAYVLNTGKWNEESTDYYSNIIEESTHLTPAQRQKSSFSSQQLSIERLNYGGELVGACAPRTRARVS